MKNKKIIIATVLIILIVIIGISCFILFRKKTYIQTFKGLTLEIPLEIKYSVSNDYEFILSTDNWSATLEPMIDEYDYMLSYPICTMKVFEDLGYKTDNLRKNEGDARKYIMFNYTEGNTNGIIVFYRINEKIVLSFILKNNKNNFDEDGLETIISIIKSIKYKSGSNSTYNTFTVDYYHECHDVNQYDKEYFEELEKLKEQEQKTVEPEEENVQ